MKDRERENMRTNVLLITVLLFGLAGDVMAERNDLPSVSAVIHPVRKPTELNIGCPGEPLISFKNLGSGTVEVLSVSKRFMELPYIKKAICKRYGHRWTYNPVIHTSDCLYRWNPDTGEALPAPDNSVRTRTCSVCGKTEQLHKEVKEEWREVNP